MKEVRPPDGGEAARTEDSAMKKRVSGLARRSQDSQLSQESPMRPSAPPDYPLPAGAPLDADAEDPKTPDRPITSAQKK